MIPVHEKQVVFYSEKYAKRARAKREAALEKARVLAVANPGNYTNATSYGAAKYIKKIEFDEDTSEIREASSILEIDIEKVKEEEALDGYYLIVSSEMKESNDRIIDMYRGLWRIEESFKVTKSELEARPVFVSTREHIEAHFLTCFIALMLSRILEIKTEHRYSIRRLLDAMVQSNCTYLKENLYLFSYHDEVLELIGEKTGIEFNHRIFSLKEIKKILGDTKK